MNKKKIEQKEAGMILAARFLQFSGDISGASRICQRMLGSSRSSGPANPTTAFEVEAMCIDNWCMLAEIDTASRVNGGQIELSSEQRKQLQNIDSMARGRGNSATDYTNEIDFLMLWVKTKQILNNPMEALNALNQVI